MTGAFEGDLVRPLGLVTLFSAYAEGEIDEMLVALCGEQFDHKIQTWTIGRKLALVQRRVRALKVESLNGLMTVLKDARKLFELRNEIIHGRLYSGGRLVSNRRSVPERLVSPEELTDLAERILSCKEHICMYRQRHLPAVIAAIGGT